MSAPGHGSDELREADLVGTWRLERWEAVDEAGTPDVPFGDAPLGYVVYTRDGHMITTISHGDRPPIGGDLTSGPPEPRLDAAATFLAYAGTFRVEGDDVLHHVEMSLFPDWIGAAQRRHVELADGGATLILSTDPMSLSGRSVRNRLTWRRVSGQG